MAVPRYIGALVLGIATAFGAWVLIAGSHPIFSVLSLAGLVPWIVAGMLGGFVAGLVAPQRKIVFASVVGIILAAVLLKFLLRHGLSHGNRNPWLWYAPIWLVPAFTIGGALSRRLWLSPNKSVERTREG
jgi:hypothetical protein